MVEYLQFWATVKSEVAQLLGTCDNQSAARSLTGKYAAALTSCRESLAKNVDTKSLEALWPSNTVASAARVLTFVELGKIVSTGRVSVSTKRAEQVVAHQAVDLLARFVAVDALIEDVFRHGSHLSIPIDDVRSCVVQEGEQLVELLDRMIAREWGSDLAGTIQSAIGVPH